MLEKEGGNAFSIHYFVTRDENHPFNKPMVDHDQYRIKSKGQ